MEVDNVYNNIDKTILLSLFCHKCMYYKLNLHTLHTAASYHKNIIIIMELGCSIYPDNAQFTHAEI